MTRKDRTIPEPKPLFVERMAKLLKGKDLEEFWRISKEPLTPSIRCNTLKISPEELKKKLEDNNDWILEQPWKDCPEVMIVKGKKPTGHEKEILREEGLAKLAPGELGRCLEHMLGYFYVQELSSLLPVIAMPPQEGELYLDMCAAPGSKTTQAAAKMNNKGTIIANEMAMGRMRILASNLERCGVTNTIVTRKEGQALMKRLAKTDLPKFDKISVDAPCSGEGTLRGSPKTFLMWNINTVKYLSKVQKELFREAFKQLRVGGELLYSTCTHSPEENEEVVDKMLQEFEDSIEIIPVKLPAKTRDGITEWEGKRYDERVKLSQRLYPQDNNTEGFFVSRFKKLKEANL
ncbi:MAG: RsmB/NOP family class I SAM-dependent RNA methyltransferase [Nanoarchaeota archaeon]|jgi:NOL1/NOP2/sun family putative RNA methylase|nr:RsmB/NOP family class I SAM-dependent RNA methyltransferase [Nanoarchaeota archaeon]